MTNRVREYVQRLSIEDLHKIAESWEKWEGEGVTAHDSPLRSHALAALPEMDSSSYIVTRMRDLAFETFRHLYYREVQENFVNGLTGKTEAQEHAEWDNLRTIAASVDDKWHKGTHEGFSLPAGKYWVGDLCYVMPDPMRRKYLELSEEHEGKFTVDGVTFGVFSTMHGDGTYPYKRTTERVVNQNTIIEHHRVDGIPVDAGSIGITPWDALPWGIDYSDGIVVEFKCELWCAAYTQGKKASGELYFGGIIVETNPKDENDDDCGC